MSPALEVATATVVGAGVMGAGIAQELAVAGVRVRLNDRTDEVLEIARRRIDEGRYGLRRGVERGKLTAAEGAAALDRIELVQDLATACEGTDVVIEAVYEDYGLKINLFGQLDRLAPRDAVLASNTSGLSIAAIAAATARPEKVIGWHFASPVPAMKLSEIVVTEMTSQDTRDTIVDLATRCGKNPEVVNDSQFTWGFVANRILYTVFREADRIVAEGVARPEQVDRLVKDCFRWPVGPFEMRSGPTSGGWGESEDLQTPRGDADAVDQRRKLLARQTDA